MKQNLFLFALILLCSVTFAQNPDQSLKGDSTWIEQPDVIIKGEELKNFPGGQLSEMLLGRLPGLDQINTTNQQSKVVFIVDGVVWWDIDAININNVEEVAYYRGGLTSKLGLQNVGSGGVILITTKTAEFNQSFNAAINTVAGNNTFKNPAGNKRSTLQSYNVVLNQGISNFSWRTSAVFNKAVNNLNEQDINRNLQLNADLRFKPLDWLELEAKANYVPGKGDLHFQETAGPFDIYYESGQRRKHLDGSLAARIQPVRGLTNEVRFFKNRIRNTINMDLEITSLPESGITSVEENQQLNKTKSSTLINDLNYKFTADRNRIKLKVGAIYQYDRLRYNGKIVNTSYTMQEHNQSMISGSVTEINSGFDIHSITTDLSANLYDIFALNGGVRRDAIVNATSNYAPFYHVTLNLREALFSAIKEVDRIDFYHSYGKHLSTTNTSDIEELSIWNQLYSQISNVNNIIERNPSIYLSSLTPNQRKSTIRTYGLKSTFLDNRLYLAGERHNNDLFSAVIFYWPSVSGSGIQHIPVLRPISIKEEGWRIWTSADILRNSAFKWSTGLNVYKNSAKLTFISDSDSQPESELAKPYKPAIQTGMQQQFSYAGFSLNLNGYAYFNHPGVSFDYYDEILVHTLQESKSTLINLNYAYLGYDFRKYIKQSSFKSLNVGIVSRNNLYHEKNLTATPSRTIGIALNTTL